MGSLQCFDSWMGHRQCIRPVQKSALIFIQKVLVLADET